MSLRQVSGPLLEKIPLSPEISWYWSYSPLYSTWTQADRTACKNRIIVLLLVTLHTEMVMPDLQRYPWKLGLINYELDIHAFVSLNCLFSFAVSLRKLLVYTLLIRSNGETHRNKHFFSQKNMMISSTFLIRLGFKGTVVNRALPSLHGRSFEITLTVPLKVKNYNTKCCG